jgi:hypothetical protein
MHCITFVPTQDALDFYEDIKDFIIKNDMQVVNNFQTYFEKKYLRLNTEGDKNQLILFIT